MIQADGGTRTASITGGCIALYDAIQKMLEQGKIKSNPFKQWVTAISVGILEGSAVLDLDYPEDSNAETDMNVVMVENGGFIEVQGTAEAAPYTIDELNTMLALGSQGCDELRDAQKASVGI